MATSPANGVKQNHVFFIATSISLIEISLLSTLSFLTAVTSIDRNFVVFLLFALSSGVIGGIGAARVFKARKFTASEIFQMIATNFAVVILLCSFMYLSLGVCGTFDSALLEAVSGLTTTSLTNLVPESLGESVLLFRSLTQWLGGAGALMLVFVALPAAGRTEEFDVAFAKSITDRTVAKTLVRLTRLYALLTAIVLVAFAIAGMSIFESLCHSLSAVSSGGFSTRNASIAGFESSAIEWVVATVMFFTGMNIVVIWWIWKQKFALISRNSELRLYMLLLVAATISFGVWTRDLGAFGDVVRDGYFLASSLLSTTGFTNGNWEFPSGMSVIVLLLLGIGAMAGSTGGGYGSARLMMHYRFARRELTQQLKPHSVRVVKVSGEVIDERSLHRLHGYTAIFISLVAIGAFFIGLASPESTPIEVLSFSLTCLATAGPFLGSDPFDSGIEFNATTHIVASMLMLLGRLSIFPIAYLGVAAFRTLKEGPLRRVGYKALRS